MLDVHCHLQDPRCPPAGEILERAAAQGIRGVICCGTQPGDWPAVAELAHSFPESLYPAFGLHPWYVENRPEIWLTELRQCLRAFPSAQVGEIGLDRQLTSAPFEVQEAVFRAQLDLAAEWQRPVQIHCLRAWPALLECVRTADRLPPALLFHSCSAPAEWIAELTAKGGWFSFSGALTYPGRKRLFRTLQAVPLSRLLIESDAPDLPAASLRCNRPATADAPLSEPAHLPLILRAMAGIRPENEKELTLAITQNAEKFLLCSG